MINLKNLLQQFKWETLANIGWMDIIQIVILFIIFTILINYLRKTRAWVLAKGLLVIGVFYLILYLTDMEVLRYLLNSVFSVLIIAIVIMLQPELQKIVEMFGKRKVTKFIKLGKKRERITGYYEEKTFDAIVSACIAMSNVKTGALIALEKDIPLKEYEATGIPIGSKISEQLLVNIFEKNTPLHDGAVIISHDRIDAATCYFQLTSMTLDKSYGTRHRAAMGLSETTDAIIICVSEETGEISVFVDGEMYKNVGERQFKELLIQNNTQKKMTEEITKNKKMRAWIPIISLLSSIAVWFIVISSTDPVIIKTFDNVKINIVNEDVLQAGLNTYTVKQGETITVVAEGKRSAINNLKKEQIYASVDLAKISNTNAVLIELKTLGVSNSIELSSKTKVVNVTMEELVQTEVPIEIKTEGFQNSKYFTHIENETLPVLQITSSKSIADIIDKAVVSVDITGRTYDFVLSKPFVLYDKNGNVISQMKYTANMETIEILASVWQTKTIPVNIEFDAVDPLTTTKTIWHDVTDYSLSRDMISIAAEDTLLSTIDNVTVTLNAEDIEGDADSIVVNIAKYLPDDVVVGKQQNEITIFLTKRKLEKQVIVINKDMIKYNTPANTALDYELIESEIVAVIDTSKVDISAITLNKLNPTCRIIDMNPGEHIAEATLTEIDGVTYVRIPKIKYCVAEDAERSFAKDDL